ncbi:hypothetical protein [Rodentibacter pneumotropicus]|uniref:hypothetical protein n=1 Tax=Rodentibacter pneumotropicus TaxID=758 RepID=UPI000985436A|nr:hypothetical protein [Rodentibacter pneumotropicus]OOF59837.1 hypothetical protein BKL50_10810 [Rodentibacter pneumotropicus]
MFKKLIIVLLFLSFPFLSFASSCISDKEYENIRAGLPTEKDFYSSVPNMVSCEKQNQLSYLICNDKKMKDAMMLLSIGFIYAYENATHTPVADYSTYNNDFRDWLNNLLSKEKDQSVAMRKLCYIIKTETWNSFGDSHYYEPITSHEVISSKINKNGAVIDTLSRIIYLGKSCDANLSGEEKIKHIWYNDGNQFVIAQFDKSNNLKELYRFNYDEKVAKLNCKKPSE